MRNFSRSRSDSSSRSRRALCAPCVARMSSSSFSWSAAPSRFWVFWMRNTIRNVTIVVPVLMTSCHVSLNPKSGPDASHAAMTAAASTNAVGWPLARAIQFAKREKGDVRYTDDTSAGRRCTVLGGRRRPGCIVGRLGGGLSLLGVLLLRASAEHLERGDDDLGLPVPLPGVVVPLARLEAALDVDQLALRQELAGDFGQTIPRDARVILGPLVVAAAILVRGDRESRD